MRFRRLTAGLTAMLTALAASAALRAQAQQEEDRAPRVCRAVRRREHLADRRGDCHDEIRRPRPPRPRASARIPEGRTPEERR